MSNTKITIYSTPICGYCRLLKEFLNQHQVNYKDIDVSMDEKAQEEMVTKSKQMGVPVTVIEKDGQEEILVGFEKEKISQLLNIQNN